MEYDAGWSQSGERLELLGTSLPPQSVRIRPQMVPSYSGYLGRTQPFALRVKSRGTSIQFDARTRRDGWMGFTACLGSAAALAAWVIWDRSTSIQPVHPMDNIATWAAVACVALGIVLLVVGRSRARVVEIDLNSGRITSTLKGWGSWVLGERGSKRAEYELGKCAWRIYRGRLSVWGRYGERVREPWLLVLAMPTEAMIVAMTKTEDRVRREADAARARVPLPVIDSGCVVAWHELRART